VGNFLSRFLQVIPLALVPRGSSMLHEIAEIYRGSLNFLTRDNTQLSPFKSLKSVSSSFDRVIKLRCGSNCRSNVDNLCIDIQLFFSKRFL